MNIKNNTQLNSFDLINFFGINILKLKNKLFMNFENKTKDVDLLEEDENTFIDESDLEDSQPDFDNFDNKDY